MVPIRSEVCTNANYNHRATIKESVSPQRYLCVLRVSVVEAGVASRGSRFDRSGARLAVIQPAVSPLALLIFRDALEQVQPRKSGHKVGVT